MRHRIIGMLLVALLGVLGISTGAASAATTSSARSSIAFTARADGTFAWAHVGGDPFVPGGVHSKGAILRLLASPRGQTCMKALGIPSWERLALNGHSQLGTTITVSSSKIKAAKAMLFGSSGCDIERSVLLTDPNYLPDGVPSFHVHVRVTSKPVIGDWGPWNKVKTTTNADGSQTIKWQRCRTSTVATKTADLFAPNPCANLVPGETGGFSKQHKTCQFKFTHVPAPPTTPPTPTPVTPPTTPPVAPPPVSPPPTPVTVALSCDKLGAVTVSGYTVTISALYTATNVTVTGATTTWANGITSSSTNVANGSVSDNHAYPGPGTYTFSVTVNGTKPDGSPISATSPVCAGSVTIPTPVYTCDKLTHTDPTVGDTSVLTAAYYTTANGAAFTGATFNWGDGSTSSSTSAVDGQANGSHSYTQPGTYTITATITVRFLDRSTATTAISAACSGTITIKRPPPPPCKHMSVGSYNVANRTI